MSWAKAFRDVGVAFAIAIMLWALTTCIARADTRDPVTCLAQNIYYEAANEPLAGKIAVAQVTMNRVADPRFPGTVCGVVYFRHRNADTGKLEAAFSWTLGAAWRAPGPIDQRKYRECREIAIGVIDGWLRSIVIGPRVEYYHAAYVHPAWARLKPVARIGDHVFYKERK